MLKDEKAGRMFSMLHRRHPVAQIARRLSDSGDTIHNSEGTTMN